MTVRFPLFVVFAIASLARDSAPLTPTGDRRPVPIVRLRGEPYSFDYYTSLSEPARLVVGEHTMWREVWASMWRTRSPQPPLPEIDFAREMVVVAALGARTTGGYGILIESADAGPTGLTIHVVSTAPGSTCAVTLAVTRPVDIARLRRHNGPVTFAERLETRECR